MGFIGNVDSPFWLLAKLGFLFALLLYVFFAFVVIRQVNLMNETLEIGLEKQIKILSYVHFSLALIVFFLAVVIL